MSLWVFLILLAFVFLITYDPKKGTLHNRFMSTPEKKETPDADPLRWRPTSGMYDPIGAIFNV